MRLPIFNLQNQKTGEKELPSQFKEPYRPDLIKRAVLSLQSRSRQSYGTFPEAGQRPSAKLSRRRRNYKGSYGLGISRSPRKILSRRGTRFNWAGAFAPHTTGGRRAHPPKAEKLWSRKINKKENRLAICSALSATLDPGLVRQHGHHPPATYPFLIDSEIETLARTKNVQEALLRLNLQEELQRPSTKKIRAGQGKLRGRKYRKKKGPLLVVSEDCPLLRSARNLPGLEIVKPNQLNAELLAPGAQAGRITFFTEKALDKLAKEKLFL